jgi:hypothetical protein
MANPPVALMPLHLFESEGKSGFVLVTQGQ